MHYETTRVFMKWPSYSEVSATDVFVSYVSTSKFPGTSLLWCSVNAGTLSTRLYITPPRPPAPPPFYLQIAIHNSTLSLKNVTPVKFQPFWIKFHSLLHEYWTFFFLSVSKKTQRSFISRLFGREFIKWERRGVSDFYWLKHPPVLLHLPVRQVPQIPGNLAHR